MGRKGEFMFDYVKDKEFLSRMRNLCGEIMQDFCHYLKEDYDIGAIFYLLYGFVRNRRNENKLHNERVQQKKLEQNEN